MADNSSIAFQIYQSIEDKQKELIKKNAIKPEEIQELSEESFIEELQASVNFHTKNIRNNAVISEIYKEILKQVDKITDISQITTKSGIKLPEGIILESVKLATERTKIEIKDNNLENDNSDNNFITQFNNIENLEEKINFYKSLSEDEKEAIRKDIYTELFGKETADEILSQEKQPSCENSEFFKELGTEEQKDVREVINSNNITTYIMEKLGLDTNSFDFKLDMFSMGIVISRLKSSMEKHSKIDEKSFSDILDILTKEMNFSEEKARDLIMNFEEQYKINPNFYADVSKFQEHKKEARNAFSKYETPIKEFFAKKNIPYDKKTIGAFYKSFNKDGNLNINAFIVNLELLYDEKELALYDVSPKKWSLKSMIDLKEELARYLESSSLYADHTHMPEKAGLGKRPSNVEVPPKFHVSPPSSVEADLLGKTETELRKKITGSYIDNTSSNDVFADFLQKKSVKRDDALINDFSLESMESLLATTFGQDTKDKMFIGKTGYPEHVEEKSVDFLYTMKAQDLTVKQEPPVERVPKIPIDIVPEALEINIVGNPATTVNEEKRSPVAKITDIKRLIEKQGHRDDIAATIAKISEIRKNGIAPIEQGKNVEGETPNEQNPSTPSDEEKE